ncbi:leucyl aminopeptidase [Acinetobacter qingfengensis]|uniref:Probable cytosol aminopeptidase n=1 Tax=Acinetobacter qingfengensis TaxID=1262585 RepID=A0A1E7QZ67_9GAMM|nr:leucyl aminopeptidase [Acinetobacter qingfengensis]KAA8733156.1 leucyl aminopeptidase [Acinetobacter qingfengensis]OEY92306.1 leucyl aminopeptidase [Acinetobacter qingfengensis]
MKLNITSHAFEKQNGTFHVSLVDEEQLQQQLQTLAITQPDQWLELSQYKAKFDETQLLIQQSNHAPALFLVGLGKARAIAGHKLIKLAHSIIKSLQNKAEKIILDLSALPQQFHYHFALALTQASYSFNQYKSKKTETILQEISFFASHLSTTQLAFIAAIHKGQNFTRDLGNQPGNICFPEYLAEQALVLAQEFPDLLKVTILDEKDMAELGMNAFLAVSQGSERPGRVVILEYSAQLEQKPVVLVGKGVTFDTGGISIKPAAGMDEMKFDMCGAATVLGVIRALCESRLAIKVVGALACAENMPSGKATRPGDIVTTLSGQTVEILNTDAEGRLVLCDTLTYIQRYDPELVIDIATLTGACVVALGQVVSGLFSADNTLANDLIEAGEQSFDRVWRLPVMEDYQELLDSPVADMGNIGGRFGGAITAACFLHRFTQEYRWAHLDIAGTAWLQGAQKGATGRPVPLLMQFLANRVQD